MDFGKAANLSSDNYLIQDNQFPCQQILGEGDFPNRFVLPRRPIDCKENSCLVDLRPGRRPVKNQQNFLRGAPECF